MPYTTGELWEDDNLRIHSGFIPGHSRLSGADVGSGIIYYPIHIDVTDNAYPVLERNDASASSLNTVWNTGFASAFVNTYASPLRFYRVELKPPSQLGLELPEGMVNQAWAALLRQDWAEPFQESVLEDLEAIRGVVEPLRLGQPPGPEALERATLAKEDLDLKLLWSTREFKIQRFLTGNFHGGLVAGFAPAAGLGNVTANTLDPSNRPVSGCTVVYTSRINHNKPGSYKQFGQFSTPTSEGLGIGNYEIWAERNGLAGSRRILSVTTTLAPHFVDLLAP